MIYNFCCKIKLKISNSPLIQIIQIFLAMFRIGDLIHVFREVVSEPYILQYKLHFTTLCK